MIYPNTLDQTIKEKRMARPKGSTNKDNSERRKEILDGIWDAMRNSKGKPLSWREMATAGGVGPATLSHHFGKRDDVVAAILKAKREEGAEPLSILATPTSDNLEQSLRDALSHMIIGLSQFDVGDLVGLGLAEGMYHETIGPQFVRDGLEPIIEGIQARLESHESRGDFRSGKDLRRAAIILAAPILLTYAHQSPLGGSGVSPTDLEALAKQSAATTRAYLEI